jgi:hypothetical protein
MKCAKILQTDAIREGDELLEKSARNFITLYATEWQYAISNHAHQTLENAQYIKPKMLQVRKDVVVLHKYLQDKINNINKSDKESYTELAQLCLAQIILFNRKRCGEAHTMKYSQVEEALVNQK